MDASRNVPSDDLRAPGTKINLFSSNVLLDPSYTDEVRERSVHQEGNEHKTRSGDFRIITKPSATSLDDQIRVIGAKHSRELPSVSTTFKLPENIL